MNGTGDAVVQARNGRAPIRWDGPAPEQADPTGGRHAFDAEGALTPIFTTLRRSGWAAQPQPAPRPVRPLWPVSDRVENFHDDPWTAEIPVVPPLHVVPDPVPAPSALETTMMWHTVDGSAAPQPPRFDGYGYEAAPYEPTGYDPAVYDLAPYEPYESHEPYEQYQPVPQGRRPYDAGDYDSGGYEPVGYYNPVTDTGRHHVRLAPAGW